MGSKWAQRGVFVGSGLLLLSLSPGNLSYIQILAWTLAWVGGNFLFARYLMPYRWLRHRGPLHSISVGLLLALAIYWVSQQQMIAVAFGVGWLSHLAADAGTKSGEPLTWPLPGPKHTHWKLVGYDDRPTWQPHTCHMWHLTHRRLRWESGNGKVEWPLALACLLGAVFVTH